MPVPSFVPAAVQEITIAQVCDFVQTVSGAGKNFPGDLPTTGTPAGTPAQTGNGFTWPADNTPHGGLIDPKALGIQEPVRVSRLIVDIGGTIASWTIQIKDTNNGNAITVLFTGTTANPGMFKNVCVLRPGEQLQVITTGGSVSSVYMNCELAVLRLGDMDFS